MRHTFRYLTCTFLLLFIAVGFLRAAVTVTVTEYVCYGDDYVWIHDGEVRKTYTNVTSKTDFTYLNENDGKEYKLSLTCLKGKKSNTSVTINLDMHETYEWSATGKTYDTPGVYLDTIYYEEEGFPDCIKEIRVLTLSGNIHSTYCKGITYVWDLFPDLTTTNSTKTLTHQESVTVKVAGSSSNYTSKWNNYVTRLDPSSSTTTIAIDEGEGFEWFGKTYHESGTYRDTIFGGNINGCDSIGVLNLTVCGTLHGDTIAGICPGTASITVWGETFTDNTTRQRIYTTKNGCDSIVTLHVVKVDTPPTRDLYVTTTEDYYWPTLKTLYKTSGDYSAVVPSYCGCDSTVTLHLTILEPVLGDTSATICEGESFEWHGQTYTEGGKYPDPLGSGIYLHLGILPKPEISVCNDKYIDAGYSAQLQAQGTDYYVWEDASTLSSPWDDQPTASPSVSTTYYVKGYSSASGNAIANGDFEAGNTGFYTEAQYCNTSGVYGKYQIVSKSNEMFGSDNMYDHTRGDATGQFMIVDGFKDPDKIIWQDTIDVKPGLDYVFSAWITSLHTSFTRNTYAALQFFVRGVDDAPDPASQQLGPVFDAPHTKGAWKRYYEQWSNTTGETKIILTIKNQNTNEHGNDFGIDDISFQALGPCYAEDSVDVIVNRYFDRDTTLYSSELPGTWEEHSITHEGNYQHRYTSVETGYPDSIEVLHVHILNDYPVHAYPDCSATIEERPDADTPDRTFTLNIEGKDDCAQTYTATYRTGDLVRLTAHEEDCYRFVRWSDDVTDPVRTITMDTDYELTAIYEQPVFKITVNYNGSQGKVTKP